MIRHIVLVRFAASTPDGERGAVLAQLGALRETVPGMAGFAAGADASPEGKAAGFTHAFTMDFADEAARDAYLVHPAHRAAATRLVAAADGEGAILVLDIPVAGGAQAG